MNPVCYINGAYLPLSEAKISIQDRGFRFGDGIFETIKVKDGGILYLEYHLERMAEGIDILKIPYSLLQLNKIFKKLIADNNLSEGFLRVSITRGIGSIGYLPSSCDLKPSIIIEVISGLPDIAESASLYLSSWKKTPDSCVPSSIKTMQGLNSVLSRMEAQQNGCYDALLLSEDDIICECSSSNIFWVKDDVLHTPSIDCGLVNGTIRRLLQTQKIIAFKEGKYKLSQLKNADCVFVTNIAWGILPIKQLQPKGWKWYVKPIINQLQDWLCQK
ncbi:aminotransferase class IV [Rickettsiales bacterium]|nr:aminotransferase class IV [Rickettsiales bacterium]